MEETGSPKQIAYKYEKHPGYRVVFANGAVVTNFAAARVVTGSSAALITGVTFRLPSAIPGCRICWICWLPKYNRNFLKFRKPSYPHTCSAPELKS